MTVSVRYIVDVVDQAIAFYTANLGFEVVGDQVLIEDPSGNAVELFFPKRGDG